MRRHGSSRPPALLSSWPYPQVITAALIDYCMMGLVFARFASPNKRSETIRFSSSAVLFQRPEDGLWCLSLRLANIRKTSLINPQVGGDGGGGNRGGGAWAGPVALSWKGREPSTFILAFCPIPQLRVHAHLHGPLSLCSPD